MDGKLKVRVEEALQTMRPFLEADGGDMELVDITDEMVVQLRLLGSCKTCGMSEMTMKAGVEEAVKRSVPEIVSVIAINT
ncbi:MAG: Fe-S cluster biogenesis protein NfuA [Bacteroidia bacterium]|jgi:Fe-S cluster biogenesis protein NfuA